MVSLSEIAALPTGFCQNPCVMHACAQGLPRQARAQASVRFRVSEFLWQMRRRVRGAEACERHLLPCCGVFGMRSA